MVMMSLVFLSFVSYDIIDDLYDLDDFNNASSNGNSNNSQPIINGQDHVNGEGNIDDSIKRKCEERLRDPELDEETNIFKNNGRDHDFTEAEKNRVVDIKNIDITNNVEGNYCIRRTATTDPDTLTNSAQNSNIGDCLQRYDERASLYSPVKNNSDSLTEIIETIDIPNG